MGCRLMAPLIRQGGRQDGPAVEVRTALTEKLRRDRKRALTSLGYGVLGGRQILDRFGWMRTLTALEAGEPVTVPGRQIAELLPPGAVEPNRRYTL